MKKREIERIIAVEVTQVQQGWVELRGAWKYAV
jgi:hypothetical protein